MLIEHKVARGETFESILRAYCIRDGKALWNLPANKSLRGKRKTPGAIQPGDRIWLPDPKETVHVFKYKGKTQLYSDSEWKAFKAAVVAQMRRKVLKPARNELTFQDQQFRNMRDMKRENPIATWLIEVVSWTELSDKERKAAHKAVNAFEAALNKGNMKAIKSSMVVMEKALVAYAKEVSSYVDDIIGGADKAYFGASITRDASFVIVGAIGVTVAAPAGATLATMVKTGFVVGSGVGFTKSVASEVGESLAGNDRSAGKIAWNVIRDTFTGGVLGSLGAGAGKYLCGKCADGLASRFLAGPNVTRMAERLVATQKSWLDKLAGGAISRLAERRGAAFAAEAASDTLSKLILRCSAGSFIGLLKSALFSDQKALKAAVKATMKQTSGKETPEQFAAKMNRNLDTEGVFTRVFNALAKQHADKFKRELEALEKASAH